MRRLLLILASAVIALAVLGPLVLVWSALYTTGGVNFVLRHLPHRLGPITLEVSGVTGTIASGLHVERVEIDHELVHITVTGLHGHVALAPLLLQAIRVTHSSVDEARIEVRVRTHPAQPGPPSFLPRWLSVSAEDAHIGKALITVHDSVRLDAHDITGAAVLRHGYIRIYQSSAVFLGMPVTALGVLKAADPLGIDGEGSLTWAPAGQPRWSVAGSARGNLDALDFDARLSSPLRAHATGQALDLTNHWHLVGKADVEDFTLAPWGIANSPLGHVTGRVEGRYDADGFSARGELTPAGLRAGAFAVQFAGRYADAVLTATRMEARHLASGARAAGDGTFAFVDPGPRLDLRGEWSDFRWPLTGRDPAVRSPSGTYTLAGVLPYAVSLKGSARAGELPLWPLEVHGTLGGDSFAFDSAEVDLYGGHASASGRVGWSPQETWEVSGRVAGVNPQALQAALPGSIGFGFNGKGKGFGDRGDVELTVSNLNGRLRGQAASGGGTIARAAGDWSFSNVRVQLGTTTLALDGRAGERLDLRYALATRDLSLLAADARGVLRASGTLGGTLSDPAIAGTAHGTGIEYGGLALAALDADVSFNPGAPQQPSHSEVRLRRLSFQDRRLENVALTVDGPPAAATVRLAAQGTGLKLDAEAAGAFGHGAFDGELRALTLAGESLHLSLGPPVPLKVSGSHGRLEHLCLTGTPGSLCVEGDWTPATWSAALTMKDLPLRPLTADLTPSVAYTGAMSAAVRLAGGAAAPLTGSVHAQLADAVIEHRLASKRIEHTRIGSGTVNLEATAALVTVQAELGDGGAGTISAHLESQRSGADWTHFPLAGTLKARTSQLDLLTLYVPDIDRAAGGFDADIRFGGTLGAPTLAGTVRVQNGEIDVYQVNFGLRQIELRAELGDSGLEFNGSAHAGSGVVSARGHLEWRDLLPYGKFHLEGSNLRVADVPEARIDASPDLDFTVTGRKIEVTGTVTLPYAKIQPRDITQAVRTSPDEVIVGSESEDPAKRFEVVSTVTLILGDKVNLDAMGLTARLIGAVTIRSGYDAITRGAGELAVAEGNYTAYARKLDIKRGRLLFSGGPIDNPGIDVVAQKQFPDVTAGVNVRGTLLQPHISFFSDPPLPQSQVASLILAGGSLQSAQNSGNAALGQGAALVAAQLGQHVGLPDVSLETDPVANETSLVLGHYLSPRLYVSYGVSLTEQLNVFKMRYTLGDHWTIRTEAGTAFGADLVYSIEKK